MREVQISNIFPFLLNSVLVGAFHILPRKSTSAQSYDPYILCNGDGPNHVEGLPAAYNEDIYARRDTLCSAAHGARQNVGCFCSTPGGNIHCDSNLADPVLWAARYVSAHEEIAHEFEVMGFLHGEVPFPQLCENSCVCTSVERANEWSAQNATGSVSLPAAGIDGLAQPPPSTTASVAEPGASMSASFEAGVVAGMIQSSDQPIWENQCGKNCTSAEDCNPVPGENSGCVCLAQRSQYQPGPGTVAFVAACLITLSTGGKRHEGSPCPCNRTYVSHSCCIASGGLVWEAEDMRLGDIIDGEES